MAFARCKVYCSKREVAPIFANIDKTSGELAKNDTPKENIVMRGFEVLPASPKFPHGQSMRTFTFSGAYPQTGIEEDARFWEASPSISFTMTVQNAAVDFVPGKYYYLDFVRAGDNAD